MTTTCQHNAIKTLSTRCFSGPVSQRDENPCAHGNITDHQECVQCGARRWVNINGCHEECGAWGPSRTERRIAADDLARRARQFVAERPAPKTIRRGDVTVEVSIDPDGYLLVVGPHTTEDEAPIARASGLLDAALRVRRAVMAAEAARAEV